MRGAGLLGLRDAKRLAHDLGNDLRRGDARVPLRDRAHDLDEVDVLVGLLVHRLQRALARERDERRAVEGRVGDRGDEVQRARPQRPEADAGAPGEPPVGVGHVGPGLLVANRDERDRRLFERVVEIERLLARDAEDVAHALGLEAAYEDVRGA